MSELAVPDPRQHPVPAGWAVEVAAPVILEAEAWAVLDEAEAQLRAFASYIEAFGGDRLEFEKAWRIVEKRRGDLLGIDVRAGERTDLSMRGGVDESDGSKSRWRTLARNWDKLWPIVVDATRVSQVTQAALLRACQPPPPPLPDGVFQVIYADPPWRYEHNETPELRAVENHYNTMAEDEIEALEVPAADDSICFLWATNPKLPEALAVLAAWGFQYRTNVAWVKDRIGMGYYVRGQHELLLIGKRGELPAPKEADRPPSVINAPRGRHSAKPAAAYDLIERMHPSLSKLELFARGTREGWTPWGNEVAA